MVQDDVEFLTELVNDPTVRATIGRFEPINFEDEREWIESASERDGDEFIITNDGTPVGVTGATYEHDAWGLAEVGYMISPEHWNNGYATAGVELLCGFLFDESRIHKVAAQVVEGNVGSRRVLEKVGFTQEGTFRNEAFIDGEYRDVLRFGLLVDEWTDRD